MRGGEGRALRRRRRVEVGGRDDAAAAWSPGGGRI